MKSESCGSVCCVSFQTPNGDHPISWIGETKIRRSISHRARFIDVRLADQDKSRDAAVGSRESVSIDIWKVDLIAFADRQFREDRRQWRKKYRGATKICARLGCTIKDVDHDKCALTTFAFTFLLLRFRF